MPRPDAAAPRWRLAARWARFRLRGGGDAWLNRGPVPRRGFAETLELGRGAVVRSLDELLAGAPGRGRLWRARPAEWIAGNPGVLTDLCTAPSPRWRPWAAGAASFESVPLAYLRLADVALNVAIGAAMPRWGAVLGETLGDWSEPRARLAGLDPGSLRRSLRRLTRARPEAILPGPALALCDAYVGNYGHWIADSLPAAWAARAALADGRLRLLAKPLFPWQRRTLERLGVPAGAIVECTDRSVLGEDLVLHSLGGIAHGHRPGPILAEVYAALRGAPGAAADSPRRLYLSRRGWESPRRLENEAELEAALARAGFVAVAPERLSVDDQVALFARAEVVVSPHGSALANVGFAPRGCLIVDVVPDRMPHPWIYGLVGALGHRLVVIGAAHDRPADPDDPEPSFPFGAPLRYRVEPRLVLERLDAALARGRPA